MSENNRRFSRIPFKTHTEVKIGDTVFSTENITNLGIGGCFLPIKTDACPGDACHVTIRLEGTTEDMAIRIEGEAVRKTDEGLAVKFVRIDPESLFHLQNILRYNSPDADVIENEIDKHPGLR
ncbi:MAG: hypothetical protein Kow0089_04640 [Desulfobulbaceae bacterium]